MKKIFLACLFIMIGFIGWAQVFTPVEIYSFAPTGSFVSTRALDEDNYLHRAIYQALGNDLRVTIFSRDNAGEIIKEFTLKNVLKPYNYETKEETNIDEFYYYSLSGYDVCVIATQSIFNDDDLWEVIISEKSGDNETQKVFNENGVYLGQVSPDNYEQIPKFYYELWEFNVGEVCVVRIEMSDDMRKVYLVSFKNANSGNSPIKMIDPKPQTIRAYPNPLPEGRDFIVEFNTPVKNGTTLNVSDLNGHAVYKSNLAEGTDKVVIPSAVGLKGNYVFSILCDGKIIESGKIIAQ